MDKEKFKGIFLVLTGAASYGILATIVKYANGLGIHTSVLTFFQFFIGVIVLFVIKLIFNKSTIIPAKSRKRLMLWGLSLGITTTLYYLSIKFIPVSVGIILLMQSIWMSLLLEIIVTKTKPSELKTGAAGLSILGTLFATNIFSSDVSLDWRGLVLGLGAGLSYTVSLYSSSSIEKECKSNIRSLYLVFGGLIFISLFWNYTIIENFTYQSLFWGVILAVFGTVLPPLLFTAGIPKTGIGVGSILSSVEIPVSIMSASLILHENIKQIQWVGVGIILVSVVIANLNLQKDKPD